MGVSFVVAAILVQRGLTDFETAKNFFRPNWTALHDPFLMKDMDKAVARILQAIKQKERIMVYGDYDVDGTTSVALVVVLTANNEKVIPYIPDRYTEATGYLIKELTKRKKKRLV